MMLKMKRKGFQAVTERIMSKCLMLEILGDLLHLQIRYFLISNEKDRL